MRQVLASVCKSYSYYPKAERLQAQFWNLPCNLQKNAYPEWEFNAFVSSQKAKALHERFTAIVDRGVCDVLPEIHFQLSTIGNHQM